jgi:hypothetical protein
MTDDLMNLSHARWRGIKRDYSAADVDYYFELPVTYRRPGAIRV